MFSQIISQNKALQRIYNQTLKEIVRFPEFWVGLILKIVLSFLFASTFLTNLFIPFVNYFSSTGFNPYDYFFLSGPPEAFPYPALMLYVLALPVKFFNLFVNLHSFPSLELFTYRIPLLLADLVILVVLTSFLKNDKRKVILFYWLSPVLVYINYIHGQLDVIPMAFIFASLYFLIKDKNFLAYLLFGCSLATKTHVFLMLPFVVAYTINQKKSVKDIILHLATMIATVVICNLAFIGNASFLTMVFKNSQQDKIFNFFFSFSELHKFYLIPAAYCLLLIRGFTIKTYNKNILIMFLGFIFGILTFFIPPSQGWYYWIIPSFAFFYIRSDSKNIYGFYILQALYFIYFLIIPESDYFQILSTKLSFIPNINFYSNFETSERLQHIVFTLLQTAVLFNCFQIYKVGIQRFSNKKISSLPYFIGIGGDSGAGKTTLSNAILKLFAENKTTIMRGDDMHKWERGDEKWKTFTHLDPKANELHDEYRLLSQLKTGHSIMRRHYDHRTGKFTSSAPIKPNNIMIFEGLHPFYIKKMRNLYDLKIYVAPAQDLHQHWKIVRDMRDRGHSQEKVIQQIKDREFDSDKYIKTQNKYADIEICILTVDGISGSENPEELKLQLCLKVSNDIHIEPLLEIYRVHGHGEVNHTYEKNDLQTILLTKLLSAEDIEAIADEAIPNMDDIGIQSPEWQSGHLGFMQLFISYYIAQQVEVSHEY